MITNEQLEILRSKVQAIVSSYVSDRDLAIAEFNSQFLSEKLDITALKAAIDKINIAKNGASEASEIWNNMIALIQAQSSQVENAKEPSVDSQIKE